MDTRIVLQTMHNIRCSGNFAPPLRGDEQDGRLQLPDGGCHLDLVTIAVVGVIVVSYVVGCLTSSVETEQKLPHRY
jgi:hypothetical protein